MLYCPHTNIQNLDLLESKSPYIVGNIKCHGKFDLKDSDLN